MFKFIGTLVSWHTYHTWHICPLCVSLPKSSIGSPSEYYSWVFTTFLRHVYRVTWVTVKRAVAFYIYKWQGESVLVENSWTAYSICHPVQIRLLLLACKIFVLNCSQAVNVTFCVLGYSTIVHIVLNFPLLCSVNFRAYSTGFNRGELHLYHTVGFYVMSINFQTVQLEHNEMTDCGPNFLFHCALALLAILYLTSSKIIMLHHHYLAFCSCI
jgi:hypothetical protein